MIFKLKNIYIASFVNWLTMQSLKGQYSRARTRFVKVLQDRLKEYSGFQKELVNKYVEKDKDGKVKTEKINGQEHFKFKKEEDKESYLKELEELGKEEFILDITEANKKDIDIIKKVTLETDYKFGPVEGSDPMQNIFAARIAVEYDEWCESLEKL